MLQACPVSAATLLLIKKKRRVLFSVEAGKRRRLSHTTLKPWAWPLTVATCTHWWRCERSSGRSSWKWGECLLLMLCKYLFYTQAHATISSQLTCCAASQRCRPTISSRAHSGTLTPCSSPNSTQPETSTTPSSCLVCTLHASARVKSPVCIIWQELLFLHR